MNFNRLSKKISDLETELLKTGLTRDYLVELKAGYVQQYLNNKIIDREERVMHFYYIHLCKIKSGDK